MTQVEQLRRHFKHFRTITTYEARSVYRIESLSRRIVDLKAMGFQFDTKLKKDLTGKRYAQYTLVKVGGK